MLITTQLALNEGTLDVESVYIALFGPTLWDLSAPVSLLGLPKLLPA